MGVSDVSLLDRLLGKALVDELRDTLDTTQQTLHTSGGRRWLMHQLANRSRHYFRFARLIGIEHARKAQFFGTARTNQLFATRSRTR